MRLLRVGSGLQRMALGPSYLGVLQLESSLEDRVLWDNKEAKEAKEEVLSFSHSRTNKRYWLMRKGGGGGRVIMLLRDGGGIILMRRLVSLLL